MEVLWVCLVIAGASTTRAEPMPDELYFRAPPLFHLDDYERCLFYDGSFCMGEFELQAEGPNQLYDDLVKLSTDKKRLNRSLLHRGLCVSSYEGDHDPAVQFQRNVNQTMQPYGLQTNLKRLHYCKSKDEPGTRPVDYTDILVADMVLLVILFNIVGTLYDFFRNPDVKPNRFLMAWSLRANWTRLTAHHTGDAALDRIAPIRGIKAHQTLFIVLGHCHTAMSMFYQKDARKTDELVTDPAFVLLKNGTVLVQTFVSLTSFLLAYMLLLHVEKTKKPVSLWRAPAIIWNRFLRMTPTVMFVISVSATWMARAGDGPQWSLVQQLEADCRAKWWTHLFYVNNLVQKDQRCLIQTWIAVDMQVFLIAVVLALLLLPNPRRAPKILAVLYAAALIVNLVLNIQWKIMPMMHMITAENLRVLLVGHATYNWMFSMPWSSAPAALAGLLLAFLHHNLRRDGFDPTTHRWLRILSWCWFPAGLAWLFTSALMDDVTDPLLLSVYATLDKNVFNILACFALWMVFNNMNECAGRYLSWRGFLVAGRLALSSLLVHWHALLAALARDSQPLEASVFKVFELWFSGTVMTLLLALLLHLMVEMPSLKLVDMLI